MILPAQQREIPSENILEVSAPPTPPPSPHPTHDKCWNTVNALYLFWQQKGEQKYCSGVQKYAGGSFYSKHSEVKMLVCEKNFAGSGQQLLAYVSGAIWSYDDLYICLLLGNIFLLACKEVTKNTYMSVSKWYTVVNCCWLVANMVCIGLWLVIILW